MTARGVQAVILVAGRGERLRPLTSRKPKSLIPVGGMPILGRLLSELEAAGIQSLVFVTGYRAAQIKRYVVENFPHLRARFFRNPIYGITNTLYSLLRARSAVEGRTFLLIDGDLVFESKVLHSILKGNSGSFLVCDSSAPLDGEAVRASGLRRGWIRQIGKNISADGILFGESIGLAKIDRQTSRRIFETGWRLLRKQGRRHYYEAAFQAMIESGTSFRAVDIKGAKWIEIDTKDDLRRARALFKESGKRAG